MTDTPVTTQISLDKTLSQLQSLAIQKLQSTYADYFAAAEEYVLDLADKAKDNESQWELFSKGRAIKQQKVQLGKRMDQAVLDAFVSFRTGKLGKQTSASDLSTSLTLIQDEDLEKSIAVSSFARRAEARYMEELFTLNQRLAMLLGGKKLADDGNPMGPIQLAEALTTMLEPLELDNQMLSQFSRLFERHSSKPLEELYKEANAYLIKQGILPNLKYSIANSRGAQSSSKPAAGAESAANMQGQEPSQGDLAQGSPMQGAGAAAHFGSEAHPAQQSFAQSRPVSSGTGQYTQQGIVPEGASPEYQQFLLNNIFQMQRQQRVVSVGEVSGVQSLPQQDSSSFIPDASSAFGVGLCPAATSIIQSVDGFQPVGPVLQRFDQEQVAPMSVSEYQEFNAAVLEAAQSEDASEDSINAIELVGKIFEYMLSDDQLPDAVKAVLSYLHTPFLKVALSDTDFLRDAHHPAKQLLDNLAEAGRRWVNNDGQSQLRIFPKIKEIVRHLMVEYSEHPEIIEELCSDMADFNLKMDKKIAVLEQRAQAKAEGEEQLRLIKRKAFHEIKRLIGRRDPPAPVLVLAYHPLADYLTLMGLRGGVDSEDWTETLDLIEYVVESVNISCVSSNPGAYAQENQIKRHRVQSILKEIAFDQNRSLKLLALLEQAQQCALDNQSFRIEDQDDELEVNHQEIEEISSVVEASDQERTVISDLVKLDFGTWLEFSDEAFLGQKRVKIAWYNAQSDRLMLSDNSGQFRVMRSAVDLAKEKLSGRMRVVTNNEKPFFERALESVLMRLKQTAA